MQYIEHQKELSAFSLPVPRELHRLLTFILREGKTKPNIFHSSGNLSLSRAIREKLDTGLPLNAHEDDVHTVAFVLMDFLSCLLTPVLPTHLLDEVVALYEATGDRDPGVLQILLHRLPKDNAMAFTLILAFFREMLACSDKNKLTPEKVAEILCECLIGEDRFAKGTKPEELVRSDTARARRGSPSKTIASKRREGQSIVKQGTHQTMPSANPR